MVLQKKITYYHNDALGSPVAATDEAGNLLWREAYQPYGDRLLKQGDAINSTWFTGKQEDKASGLSYFHARWYDPVVGRFTAIDPVDFQEDNIHSFNRYTYANNNPYKFVDPDGNSPVLAYEGSVILTTGLIKALGWTTVLTSGGAALYDLLHGKNGLLNKNADDGDNNNHKGTRGPISAPDRLPAFPDAEPSKPKTSVQGGGGKRKRWKDKNGKIYEWDSQHGTVEKYSKSGNKHLGEFDPNTGGQIKPPNKGRNVEK